MKILGISSLGLIVLLILALPFSVAHAQETKIPVIIVYKEKITKIHTDKIKERHGEVKKTWKVLNGLATDLSPTDIEELKKDPSVSSVEMDLSVHTLDVIADQQIRADQVWAVGNIGGDSSSRVPVAILDTGIDNAHPEFTGRITLCHSEITNSNVCQDQNGHGTHVAGIVGATGINSNAKGVAPGVQYYIDQVLDSTGSGSFSGVISGIDWAVANHAKVISMSLGSSPLVTTALNCDSQFPALTTAINNAVNAGVTVVAAAGNSGTQGVGAPGCMSNVIAVTAVDSNNVIASWSSKGGPITDHGIAAPGVNIFSTYIPQTYATLSGTSMATPAVSGTIALLLQANPSLTPTQVKNTLFSTACTTQTNPACQTGSVPNTSYGYGRVDALAAYNKISIPTSPDFTISSNPSTLSLVQATSGQTTLTLTPSNGFTTLTLVTGTLPAGVTSTLTPVSLDLTTGVQTSVLGFIVDANTAVGTYPITVTASGGGKTHSTTVNLTVTSSNPQQLSVNVTTDKSSYSTKSTAKITVNVSFNSTPISGSTVVIQVKDPRGPTSQASGITDATGKIVFSYKIPRGHTGIYTITSTANAPNYLQGTATATFTAK